MVVGPLLPAKCLNCGGTVRGSTGTLELEGVLDRGACPMIGGGLVGVLGLKVPPLRPPWSSPMRARGTT